LAKYIREVAGTKRRAYLDWEYWGKPVPSFGPGDARVLIVGLAPGAHGANRTGRVFTGDSSGKFLYRALFETGFASQPESVSRGDGMRLVDARSLLGRVQVLVALGRIAFDDVLTIHGKKKRDFAFGHNREYSLGAGMPFLVSSYHPSQQNTSTGKLTAEMLRGVFERVRGLVR
jgi:uracil-DNA glycosylase